MAANTVFVVQAFEVHRKKLAPTTKTDARNADAAARQAEQIAVRKAGAAVIQITADDETGEVSEAKVLARYGSVPDDLDQLVASF